MCKPKEQYLILSRRPASVGFALLVFLAVLVASCDEAERHRVLNYFFDGVPPLDGQEVQGDLMDPNSQPSGAMAQTPTWYVHEPRKDCTNCHRRRAPGGFLAQTYLIAPVPRLCHNCHADDTASAAFVHGPVAIGQCLFCHNPHKSKIEHLLTKPEPELCYLCHDVSMIELIPAHLPQQTSACTDCHYAHAGSTKALLKGDSVEANEELEGPGAAGAAVPDDIKVAAEQKEQGQRDSLLSARQREIAELYYQSMTFYREGQLTRARDGFVRVLTSGLIPAPMAETLRAHVADIDGRLARGASPSETSSVSGPLN